MKYEWSDGCGGRGSVDTREDALEMIRERNPWIDEAVVVTNDDITEYFYETQEGADADEDGAYAVQITKTEEE